MCYSATLPFAHVCYLCSCHTYSAIRYFNYFPITYIPSPFCVQAKPSAMSFFATACEYVPSVSLFVSVAFSLNTSASSMPENVQPDILFTVPESILHATPFSFATNSHLIISPIMPSDFKATAGALLTMFGEDENLQSVSFINVCTGQAFL